MIKQTTFTLQNFIYWTFKWHLKVSKNMYFSKTNRSLLPKFYEYNNFMNTMAGAIRR